ncbi:MAG: hypothetical protein H6827_07060 [Planctomycetes bacterium]|nr:hypothetical protein [Planctomycetota bacterium]HPF13768.1 di-heme oxidoredictase family protein [Planctomycetota bacterium]
MIQLRPQFAMVCLPFAFLMGASFGQADGPALGTQRITQADIVGGSLSLRDIRLAGLRMFATPFNKLDGYGDGPMNPFDTTSPGGRPTLQGNGTFLRVNGLDAQTCMECHSVGSNATVPFTFAVGGVGGSNNNAIFQPRNIDVDDEGGSGFAAFDGRYINPPFLFGSGGVELLAAEMTEDLQGMLALAPTLPDVTMPLETHGVSFGTLRFDSATQTMDLSGVEGIDADLVVRPFGRKGEFATVRAFDIGAMQFHFGMQPVEVVGAGVDDDQDGVVDEIGIGELSALHIFNTNLEHAEVRDWTLEARQGADRFHQIGCAHCHTPKIDSRSRFLRYRFPEVETDPSQNEFLRVDLSTSPARLEPKSGGGLSIYLLSDLKRHDMGPGLAESFGSVLDSHFVTARLWGVADTAPYLHDGRATTLTDAILAHGGEAQAARDAFAALDPTKQTQILTFLKRLRTPRSPARDLLH